MTGKKLFTLISLAALIGMSTVGCNSSGKKVESDSTKTKREAAVIRDNELYPFMLAGVYFFHGYGGAANVFNSMIKPIAQGEPGTEIFAKSLQKAYGQYFIFPFKPQDDPGGADAKSTLSKYWKVNSKAELETDLNWLLEEGDQMQYAFLRKILDENGGATADLDKIDLKKYDLPKESVLALGFIKANYNDFSKAGIKAWDYARYVNNICVAYQAEYLNRDEATVWLRKATLAAQQSYTDWRSYYNDFLLGREFWGGGETDTPQFAKDVNEMMEGEYSIYNYMPINQ
jgi:hypothetical protein